MMQQTKNAEGEQTSREKGESGMRKPSFSPRTSICLSAVRKTRLLNCFCGQKLEKETLTEADKLLYQLKFDFFMKG